MKITDAIIDSFTVGEVTLSFSTDEPVTKDHYFEIYRTESRGEKFDLAKSKKIGVTCGTIFRDKTLIDIGLIRQTWYWILAFKKDGPADIRLSINGPFHPGHKIPVLGIEIVRRLEIFLKHGGIVASVYTLNQGEGRCPICWDDIKHCR